MKRPGGPSHATIRRTEDNMAVKNRLSRGILVGYGGFRGVRTNRSFIDKDNDVKVKKPVQTKLRGFSVKMLTYFSASSVKMVMELLHVHYVFHIFQHLMLVCSEGLGTVCQSSERCMRRWFRAVS